MKKITKFLSVGLILLPSLYSHAAMVTVDGTDVSFTYNDATLFGEANVIGNSIFFLFTDTDGFSTNFSAESLNGAGAVTATETLNITVKALTDGYAIDNFLLQESGDYKLSGTDASASVGGMLAVTSLTKTTSTIIGGIEFPEVLRKEQLFNTGALTDTAGTVAGWSTSAGVDLGAISGWGSDTEVKVTLENLLAATTLNNGELAFVEKKFEGVGLIINPIPVPAAVWLFGSGLLGLVGIARRKA